jgi:hypothetical protein
MNLMIYTHTHTHGVCVKDTHQYNKKVCNIKLGTYGAVWCTGI